MKRVFKCFIIILAVCLCFSAFGCGKRSGGGFVGDGDYTKLTGQVKILLPGSRPNDHDAVISAVNKKLKADKRNYTIAVEYEGWGDYWSKIGLRATEGFDAAWMHADKMAGFYGQKVIKPLDEYIDLYGKTLKSTTSEIYWKTAKIAGKIYTVPRIAPLSEVYSPMAVRGDWMQEFGLNKIETLSEFDTYVEKAAEKLDGVPGAYVMDKDHSEFLRREYAKNYYFPLGSFSCNPVYIDISKKVDGKYKVMSFYESQAFKDMANKANEYYRKGYKNPSRTALESNLIDANFNNNLLGAIWSAPVKTPERIESFTSKNPEGSIKDVVLNPTEDKWIMSGENSIACFSMSDKTPHVIDFLDWLRQDRANFDLFAYGVEGVNYKLEGDKLDFNGIAANKNYSIGFPSFAFSTTENVRYSKLVSDEQIAFINAWDAGDNVKVSPLAGFMPEYKGKFNTYYTMVSAVEKQYSEDFLYGIKSISDASYNTFISQLKANRLNEVIAELQAQIDAYCQANNI